MKTLCQLVLMYKSDVETRIQCIKEEWDACDESVLHDEDCMNAHDEQLAHWQATWEMINETIEESGIEFELDNPETDNEHEHDKNCRYLGSGIWNCGTIDQH